MNIMIFDATPHWSGGANRIFLYSNELKKRGHDVTICCLPGSGLAHRLPEINIQVHTVNPKSDLNVFIVPKLIRLLRENNIDVIEICSPKFYWVASVAAKLSARKVILTRNVPYRKTGIKKLINRILYDKLTDRIIAISDKIKRELIEDFSLQNDKITVIYDGIDLMQFKQRTTEQHRVKQERYVAAVISRLDENKGVECFINAIPKIAEKIKSVDFLIVGTGSIENKLKALTKQLKISERVRFTGFRQDIPEILSTVDITIMPSPKEGMSMSALESMASGVPVVATTGSGLADVIVNNSSGALVPPDNSNELAAGVIRLLQSDYHQAGKAARKIVEEKFSLQNVVTKYELLIAEITKPETSNPVK
ncbi:MAG: glycosyltransferase family 4 protein [Chlorobium sp.]|nr:MAG: glycosyltransferase family 4 protein [Chlorobium sp.]